MISFRVKFATVEDDLAQERQHARRAQLAKRLRTDKLRLVATQDDGVLIYQGEHQPPKSATQRNLSRRAIHAYMRPRTYPVVTWRILSSQFFPSHGAKCWCPKCNRVRK